MKPRVTRIMHISMQNLFNELNDGVMVFTTDGSLVFMNESVRRWVLLPHQIENATEYIWTKVKEAMESGVAGPLTVVLDLRRGADGRWPVHFDDIGILVPSPRPTEVVLLLRPANVTESIARTTRGMKELLEGELDLCLSGILDAMERAETHEERSSSEATTSARLKYEISARISAARTLLTEFEGALKLSLAAPLIDSERVHVDSLLERVAGDMCSHLSARELQITVNYRDEVLAPVYGSSLWLEKALKALLEHMRPPERSNTNLNVEMKQLNNHIQLTMKHSNVACREKMSSSRFPRRESVSRPSSSQSGVELSLVFARKVIEAHGGKLKVFQDLDGFSEIHVQLPTGRPPSDDAALQLQLECYAKDLNYMLRKSVGNIARKRSTH